ncbi:low-affinity phosphate transporter [Tulasnella sp. 418]|nr:low-affinity phosphate transporter [Tulasnella sp. 418]
MKFSHSLKFNAVAEWWDEYIAYSALKKKIYEVPQSSYSDHPADTHEESRLMAGNGSSANDQFIPLLDRELNKITSFYIVQAKEIESELEEVKQLVDEKEAQGLRPTPEYLDDDGDDDDDDDDGSPSRASRSRKTSVSEPPSPIATRRDHSRGRRSSTSSNYDLEASMHSNAMSETTNGTRITRPLSRIFGRRNSFGPETIWTSKSDYATDTRMIFKRRITTLYINATSLKSYVELNYSGFRKILKKYDKVTFNELKDNYMHNSVEKHAPFLQESKDRLNQIIAQIIALYARCVTANDLSAAAKQLRIHQREHIVWERDTVWRQMIGQERRGESDGQIKALGGSVEGAENPILAVPTPVGRIKITNKGISLLIALATFILLLNLDLIEGEEANRCFAILCFSTILWATEAIPLFVTSMLVPLLVVCLRVVRSDDPFHDRLSPHEATKYIFSIMFSPTIMLLIGGFTIASALSKTNIDRILITRVLSLAGTRPSIVLLAFMFVSCFASMWISNVAAPTLCFTLIRPILVNLPPGSRFAPCVILGIALAANIGGQSSPISSPQNLIALQAMEPPLDWLGWFAVALPVSGLSIVLIWLLLLASYNPSRTLDGEEIIIKPIRASKDRFTAKQYFVSFVCIGTIALWCFEHALEDVIGDMGIIAIIPVLAFFGTGVLKKADFDQFLWTVVFLAMGGIALGKAVTTSGLLETMDIVIRDMVTGLSTYAVVLSLSAVVVVVSTFISHTIAAVLLVPIAKEVGANLPGSPARLLIFVTGLVASAGMALPVSGFPNQTAASQEDEIGQLYLSTADFIYNGVPASLISTVVVATVGYSLMKFTGI